MSQFVKLQTTIKHVSESLKEFLNPKIMEDKMALQALYEQLLILKTEIEEGIKGIEECMKDKENFDIEDLLKKLAAKGLQKITVKPLEDRFTVELDLTQGKILIVDVYKILCPYLWVEGEAFKEVTLREAEKLLKDVWYIDVENLKGSEARRFSSWRELLSIAPFL
jgi:hypothetical protein